MGVTIRKPTARQCEDCGRKEVWNDATSTWRVARDDDGDLRTSSPLTDSVRVAPERDPFVVTVDRTNVTAGERTTVTLTVTNNRGEPVRDGRAKAFADAPLPVDDDQAFVAREVDQVMLQRRGVGVPDFAPVAHRDRSLRSTSP